VNRSVTSGFGSGHMIGCSIQGRWPFLSGARCAASSGLWGCIGRGGFHNPRMRKSFPVCRYATASHAASPNHLSIQNRQSSQCSWSSTPCTFCSLYPSWCCQLLLRLIVDFTWLPHVAELTRVSLSRALERVRAVNVGSGPDVRSGRRARHSV
jgi:hypothetical protein